MSMRIGPKGKKYTGTEATIMSYLKLIAEAHRVALGPFTTNACRRQSNEAVDPANWPGKPG